MTILQCRPPPLNLASQSLKSIAALQQAGLVAAGDASELEAVAARYAVAVTPTIAALISGHGRDDPMARQFVPDIRELITTATERADPIGDEAHSPVEGVVHRYADRALLKIIHSCPVYCRFCFRREMVGPAKPALTGPKLEAALAYLGATPALWEIVMTGGDPFMLSARRVRDLTQRIAAMPHIKVLRWHTRVPMVDPLRVTPEFARALKTRGLSNWVAIHANHPREFTVDAIAALQRLREAGVNLISQSVLLKGVNDNVDTLEQLMRLFVENGVKPYYLHHPDMAQGTAHFRVAIAEGRQLIHGLRQRISGLAMPLYVLDIPGGHGKAHAGEAHLADTDEPGRYMAKDRSGSAHAYCDDQG